MALFLFFGRGTRIDAAHIPSDAFLSPVSTIHGRVTDASTGEPIAGAVLSAGGDVTRTDAGGGFTVNATAACLKVRAPGYRRSEWAPPSRAEDSFSIRLEPFTPKALYLSFYGVADGNLREKALNLLEETELNALVIDVKGDRGQVVFRSTVPLASEVGAQRIIPVKDMPALVASLKEREVYLIARIVVFKDSPLAGARPELALRNGEGEPWRDREGSAWVDPFREEVWRYNIDLAVEAARLGFDEIQFDYVRFPDAGGISYSRPWTQENRVKAITGFLAEARRRLEPCNVFLAADIFGYVCWNQTDTFIGQMVEEVAGQVDYLSPMLYPSGFSFGIPGHRNPVASAGAIVNLTLRNARKRLALPAVRFRPWLQAFRDYAFDRRHFGAVEVRAQIDASEDFGSHGWMLWNPRNLYSDAGLREEKALPSRTASSDPAPAPAPFPGTGLERLVPPSTGSIPVASDPVLPLPGDIRRHHGREVRCPTGSTVPLRTLDWPSLVFNPRLPQQAPGPHHRERRQDRLPREALPLPADSRSHLHRLVRIEPAPVPPRGFPNRRRPGFPPSVGRRTT